MNLLDKIEEKQEPKEWVITLPTIVKPVGSSTYRSITVYFVKSLRTSPAFTEGGRIFIDKEFYSLSPELRRFILEHEFRELAGEPHERIVESEDPVLRERSTRMWVDMVVSRLKKNPELIEETMKAWGPVSYILKERL